MLKKSFVLAAMLASSVGANAAVVTLGAVTNTYTLSTGTGAVIQSSVESFLGLSANALDNLGRGNATEGSAIKDSLAVAAGATLSFNWNWNSGEGSGSSFNDFAFVSISFGGITILADTFTPDNTNGVFSFVAPTAGTLTYGVGVMDVGDNIVDSTLTVSNLKVVNAVPEPSSVLLAGLGLLGAAAARRRKTAR